MDLQKPIAEKIPFARGVQQRLDSLNYMPLGSIQCENRLQFYFVAAPGGTTAEEASRYREDLKKRMGKCENHPSRIEMGT